VKRSERNLTLTEQYGHVHTSFEITREDLESWKRRSVVVLRYSVQVFKQSVRTYKMVSAVNGKPLKKTRYDYKTGKNNFGGAASSTNLTRKAMDELLDMNQDTFKIFVSTGGTDTTVFIFVGNYVHEL